MDRLINEVIGSLNNLPASYKVVLIRIYKQIIEELKTLNKIKVDKEEGKELSSNDFTDEFKEKLENIPEEFIQQNADWNATSGVTKILNKPNLTVYPDSAIWDEENKNIVFKHQGSVLPEMTISGTTFIKDGMVDDVKIENGNLVITFNTESGKQPISIPISDIFDATNYYTKQQADDKFVEKVTGKSLSTEDFTTGEKTKLAGIETGAQINKIEKIKVNDIEQEINNKIVNLNIPDVSQFITKSVDNLVNYYLKSEVYTKQEVAALIAAISQFHYEIYATLPASGENNVLYLIGPIGTGSDKYEEYVYANNTWTKIGDTSIDLSGYATIGVLSAALANYTTTANLTTLLDNKQNTLVSGTNIKTINGTNILGSGNIEIQPGKDAMTSITWSELKILRDNSQLTPGIQYRITDYQCTTVQEDTRSANHQFDIIVVADSVNKLNENARACLHEGDTYFSNAGVKLEAWQLKYSLDNNANKFAWADTENGKGVIYWMKDEWNNECPYDFKNIQFSRYKITACPKSPSLVGQYSINGVNDITVDTATTYWCYTFTWINEDSEIEDLSIVGQILSNDEGQYNGVFDNKIESSSFYYLEPDNPSSFTFALNNNCFISIYEYDDDGFFYGCYANRLESDCYFNTFGNKNNNNTFGNNCSRNTFGNDCFNNTFGNDCLRNTFGDYCSSNIFGNDCLRNTFGDYCSSNIFGNYCGGNTFGDYCSSNTFGNDCSYNTFGNDCLNNIFGNYCQSNTFGNYCQRNTFGNYCERIIINKGYVNYAIVENGNHAITITSSLTTSIVNKLQNIKIAQGVNNNTLTVKTISHNTVNDTFQTIYKATGSTEVEV